MPNDPPFYPAESLAEHGVDDWSASGCYALSLAVPEDFDALRERWYKHYTIEPPEPLVNAVDAGLDACYLGAAKRLRARLADHVRGDVRQAGVLAVCPATGVREVFVDDDPFQNETMYALRYSQNHPETLVACNGDWF